MPEKPKDQSDSSEEKDEETKPATPKPRGRSFGALGHERQK